MTFEEQQLYHDAVGRLWEIVQIVRLHPGETLLLLRRHKPITNLWAIAVDNGDDTATIMEKEGFTTIYAEEEKE